VNTALFPSTHFSVGNEKREKA